MFNIPSHIRLADPDFHSMLLGAEILYDLLDHNKISLVVPLTSFQNSMLGRIVKGSLHNSLSQLRLASYFVRDPLSIQLEKIWKIEGVKMIYLSKEEAEGEKHLVENVRRVGEGRYVVRLPLKKTKEELGRLYELASRRIFILEQKLLENDETI